ncbi:MAG: cytidylyltransferase domain-containing protein [Pseudomonadota bacterium]
MILCVLQARMGSTRLPGKVLAPILGKPMLARQIERIARARLLDRLVIATSGQAEDDPLAALAQALKVDCYRGAVDDVLDRFYQCAKRYNADHVVRLTGDCPLIDPDLIDAVVRLHLAGRHDYSSNVLPPTYPDGLDVEAMTRQALNLAWENASKPSQREHVTSYITGRAKGFSIGNLTSEIDRSSQRWTVDEPEDLAFVQAVFAALYPDNPRFSSHDVLDFLGAHPDVAALNSHIARNAGYEATLARNAMEPRP